MAMVAAIACPQGTENTYFSSMPVVVFEKPACPVRRKIRAHFEMRQGLPFFGTKLFDLRMNLGFTGRAVRSDKLEYSRKRKCTT